MTRAANEDDVPEGRGGEPTRAATGDDAVGDHDGDPTARGTDQDGPDPVAADGPPITSTYAQGGLVGDPGEAVSSDRQDEGSDGDGPDHPAEHRPGRR